MTSILIESGSRALSIDELPSFSCPWFDDASLDKFMTNKLSVLTNCRNIILELTMGDVKNEFNALRLAHHIRLTGKLHKSIRLGKIIILTELSLKEIFLSSSDPLICKILLTPNVILVKYDMNEIQALDSTSEKMSNAEYLNKFLPTISITKPPKFGNHSISNLWGAIRFNQIYPDFSLKSKRKNDEKSLYIKYLKSKSKVDIDQSGLIESRFICQLGGVRNILLLDDHEEIWKPILEVILDKNIDSVKHNSDDVEFMENVEEIIKNKKYEIIFLDLRLLKSEEGENLKPSEYSGYKILNKIKNDINKGTQVIMLTASNKAWNMKALLESGADGYFVKESPYEFSLKDSVANYNSLVSTINKCASRVYLKEIWIKIKEIYGFMSCSDTPLFNSILERYESIFDFLSLTSNFKFVYLNLFHILEEVINSDLFFEKGEKCYVHLDESASLLVLDFIEKKGTKYIYNSSLKYSIFSKEYSIRRSRYDHYIDTNFIMSSILIYRFGCKNSNSKDWVAINDVRNQKVGHPGEEVTINELNNLLDFMLWFFNPESINIKRNSKSALGLRDNNTPLDISGLPENMLG